VADAVLAVDYGTVRIGLAICERLDLPALPLDTIEHTSLVKDAAAVAAAARERGAGTIVVGYPLRLDGQAGPAAKSVDKFVDALRGAFSGTVVTFDERLTSAAAAKRLAATGMSGSKRRRLIDRFAAVEILESYRSRMRAQ
jgi:putative holliday junction resolvase